MRTVITTVAFLVVLAAILFVPVPRTLRAPGQIAGVQSTPIYVTAPGELSADLAVQPGEWVNEGTPLAELRNREIEQEVIQLEAQVRRQEIRVANLEARRSTEPNAAEVLPTARETLKDLQQRRDQAISEQSRLRIVAPRSGVLVAAEPNLVGGPLSAEGTPLDERNRDAWLETGTLFARLVDREARDAVLFVEQADVASLRVGLPVRVSIPQQAGEVLDGKVTEISRQPLLIVPPTFAARSLIPVRATADGQLRPLKPMHEVRVRLSQPSEELVLSQDVEGAIRLKAEPLATQAWRAIRRTLRPDL